MASRESRIIGKTSYSTSMRVKAFSAISAVSAATNATRSPTKRTFLSSENASNGPGIGSDCPAVEYTTRGISCQVSTATTPSSALALLVSIFLISACACGECKTFACNNPRFSKSAVKAGLPCTSLTASTFISGLPTVCQVFDSGVSTTLGRVITPAVCGVEKSLLGESLGGPPKSQLIAFHSTGSSPRISAAAFNTACTGLR